MNIILSDRAKREMLYAKPNYFYQTVEKFAQQYNTGFLIRGDDLYENVSWEKTPHPTKEEIDSEVARLNADWAAKEYQRKRQLEYPPMEEYIDAVVKNDTAAINSYIASCQAIKAKYPKP